MQGGVIECLVNLVNFVLYMFEKEKKAKEMNASPTTHTIIMKRKELKEIDASLTTPVTYNEKEKEKRKRTNDANTQNNTRTEKEKTMKKVTSHHTSTNFLVPEKRAKTTLATKYG